jgi:hypothetical protein
MDLNNIRTFLNIILRDHAPERMSMTPEQFIELLNICSLLHFKKKVGLPEEYRPGMPLPRQAYEITKKLSIDLNPFKVAMGDDTPPLVVDAYGHATLPAGCYYPTAFAFRLFRNGEVDIREIDIVNDQQWFERQGNRITKPSQKYPIVQFIGGGKVRFSPFNLLRVDMTYLKLPTPAVYGYTITSDFIKYNASTSTQLEWDDINIIDIIFMFLERIGVQISRQDLIQYSNKVNTQGA